MIKSGSVAYILELCIDQGLDPVCVFGSGHFGRTRVLDLPEDPDRLLAAHHPPDRSGQDLRGLH